MRESTDSRPAPTWEMCARSLQCRGGALHPPQQTPRETLCLYPIEILLSGKALTGNEFTDHRRLDFLMVEIQLNPADRERRAGMRTFGVFLGALAGGGGAA